MEYFSKKKIGVVDECTKAEAWKNSELKLIASFVSSGFAFDLNKFL